MSSPPSFKQGERPLETTLVRPLCEGRLGLLSCLLLDKVPKFSGLNLQHLVQARALEHLFRCWWCCFGRCRTFTRCLAGGDRATRRNIFAGYTHFWVFCFLCLLQHDLQHAFTVMMYNPLTKPPEIRSKNILLQ